MQTLTEIQHFRYEKAMMQTLQEIDHFGDENSQRETDTF